jgi:CDP-glycerol glycerophosphotransferase
MLALTLPKNEKLIVFESFLGKQYSCNPRAIYEYLKEHHPGYQMVWSVDKQCTEKFESRDLPYVRRFSISWLFTMTRAKYWVTNCRLPLWMTKSPKTVYVQTWHGTPLKKLGLDMEEVHMPGTNTNKYKRNFIKESGKWDFLISPNAYSTDIFRRAFLFGKNMIESGYPRNDFLIRHNHERTIERIKKICGLPPGKKVILYAPTWRDNQYYAKGRYKFDLQLDVDAVKRELADEYVIALRLHYLIADNLDLAGYEGFVYDFSEYDDIRDLYLISDLLVTDYSSVFFDYANLKRPMIFYVYDMDDYRDNLRGFYFDFEKEAPGPLVRTTEELIREIKNAENHSLSEKWNAFYDKFCYLEKGNASERVVNEIFSPRPSERTAYEISVDRH